MILDTPMLSMIQSWRTDTQALASPIFKADEHFFGRMFIICLRHPIITTSTPLLSVAENANHRMAGSTQGRMLRAIL